MTSIDLNCDMGEGVNNEEDIMPFISSCNIACGQHAGGRETARHVIRLALKNGVRIGAHPSFPDRENFGRKDMNMPPVEISKTVANQIKWLAEIASKEGADLKYVKPHGALYNMASRSAEISVAIIEGIKKVSHELAFMGLANSEMETSAEGRISFIAEGFADRKYASVNELVPRSKDGLITNLNEILDQIKFLVVHNQVRTSGGIETLMIDSICLHGDTPGATETIRAIHDFLKNSQIRIHA